MTLFPLLAFPFARVRFCSEGISDERVLRSDDKPSRGCALRCGSWHERKFVKPGESLNEVRGSHNSG
jgi:hypothetical protein